jgi:hypothetical protein
VGAGLPAKAECQAQMMLDLKASSQARQLPQDCSEMKKLPANGLELRSFLTNKQDKSHGT